MKFAANRMPAPEEYPVLSGAGNGEVKAVIFAAIEPDIPQSLVEIRDRLIQLQGTSPAWAAVQSNSIQAHCETYSKAGLVEFTESNPPKISLTEAGVRALPRIGWLLNLSLAEDPPLYGYFGPSKRHSPNSPWPSQRRIKILDLLLDAGQNQIPLAAVRDHIGTPESTAMRVVDDLALYGLISTHMNKPSPVTKYFTNDSIRERTAHTPFSQDMLTILINHHATAPEEPLTTRQVADQLAMLGHTEPDFIPRVGGRLHQLAEKFGALRAERMFRKGVRNVIWATPNQLHNIEMLFETLNRPRDDSGQTVLEGILGNEMNINYLIAKGRAASNSVRYYSESRDILSDAVRTVLDEASDNPLTVRQVWEQLQDKGLKYDPSTVYDHLRELRGLNQVSETDTPTGRTYVLHNPERRQAPVTKLFDRMLTLDDLQRLNVDAKRLEAAKRVVTASSGGSATEIVDGKVVLRGINLQKLLIILFKLRLDDAEHYLHVRPGLIGQFTSEKSSDSDSQGLITDPDAWHEIVREFRPDLLDFSALPDRPPSEYGFCDTAQLLAFIQSHGGDYRLIDDTIFVSYPAQELLEMQLRRDTLSSATEEQYVGWQNTDELAGSYIRSRAETVAWAQALPSKVGYLGSHRMAWIRSRQTPHHVLPHYSPAIVKLFGHIMQQRMDDELMEDRRKKLYYPR